MECGGLPPLSTNQLYRKPVDRNSQPVFIFYFLRVERLGFGSVHHLTLCRPFYGEPGNIGCYIG